MRHYKTSLALHALFFLLFLGARSGQGAGQDSHLEMPINRPSHPVSEPVDCKDEASAKESESAVYRISKETAKKDSFHISKLCTPVGAGYTDVQLQATLTFSVNGCPKTKTFVSPAFDRRYQLKSCKDATLQSSADTKALAKDFDDIVNGNLIIEKIPQDFVQGAHLVHTTKLLCYEPYLRIFISASDTSKFTDWEVKKNAVPCP